MILGIETATSILGVALAHEGRIVASISVARKNAHDDLLVPVCRDVLAYAGKDMSDLVAVAISSGPGSYTGLRIGMAAAKGLCLTLAIPLIAVPTCDAAAESAARSSLDDDASVAVCLDAKNNEVYIATYGVRSGHAVRRHPVAILPIVEAAQRVDSGTLLLGDGATAVAFHLSGACRIADDTAQSFNGDCVALLGEILAARKEFSDIASCEPLYLREFQVKLPQSIPGA